MNPYFSGMGPATQFPEPVPIPSPSITDAPLWSLCINADWMILVLSACKALMQETTWASDDRAVIAEAVRQAFKIPELIGEECIGVTAIGTIVAYATSSPPSGCLACDGSTHLRVDYPALYAVLASAYIEDGDHFHVPDLRGRAIVGVGTGPGLTARAMNDSGGAEKHALSVAELAQHHHTYVKPTAYIAVGGTGNQAVYPAFADNTGDTGSGSAHENMQPWCALAYAIVAQ